MKKLSSQKIETFEMYYGYWEEILKNEIDSLWSIMVYIVGKRGVGKSVAAIKDALTLDPNFSVEQICFTKDQVNEFIEKYAYQGGKVGIWDEFGAEMHARTWYEDKQKSLVQKLEVIRETDITFFVVMPHIIFGDSSIDVLANFAIELHKPKHRNDPYRLGKALEMGGLYSKRQRMDFRPIWLEGQIFHVPYMNPINDHKALFGAYWKKKRAYVEEKIQEDKERGQGIGLTVVQMRYLKAFVAGKSVSEIADDFNVSEPSVKEMKRKLRRKGVLNDID